MVGLLKDLFGNPLRLFFAANETNKGFHVQAKAVYVGVDLHRTLAKTVHAARMDAAAGGQQTVFVEKPLVSTKSYQRDWTTSS